ncbi:TIGR02453 family protein [Penicillium digitatum]|uniref:TIGR02453 family protein n=1 Tax=Penicillium digitatum TaxID=36651 RepID=A0A7T6XNJ5_PENDI|nr:TIGR02453 family protein [Penicillium digitatum]
MPQRSCRPDPTSPGAPTAPKRRASARLSAGEPGVKRVKSNVELSLHQAKSTASKSKYFEPEDSDEPDTDSDASVGESSGSVYEEPKEESPADEVEPEEFSDTDEDAKKKFSARGKQRQSASSGNDSIKGKELWREGVRAGLEPGQEVIIAKPKARDAGKTPYQDETLHPNTRLFLIDLAGNNDRQWLKAHDADYRAAKKDFETFVGSLTPKIVEVDTTIPELPVKDLVIRIHRDLRFSKNPLPYKTHFSAAWSRTGRKGPYAAYYVHFQPGTCSIGCGLWNPESEPLALLREDIDENSAGLKDVLRAPDMRRKFLKGAPDDDDAVVDAFVHHNRESALKTKPKGYEADNKNIKLLRLRSFTIGKPISDEELTGDDAQEKIAALVGVMEPFVTYLNSVVMPDQ